MPRPILIVDDNKEAREALDEALRDAGYHVFTAGDGREALDRLKIMGDTGLILLDLIMPGMNGWQLCEELKKDPHLRSIPVVVLSDYADTQDPPPHSRERLGKPVDFAKLKATVARYCE